METPPILNYGTFLTVVETCKYNPCIAELFSEKKLRILAEEMNIYNTHNYTKYIETIRRYRFDRKYLFTYFDSLNENSEFIMFHQENIINDHGYMSYNNCKRVKRYILYTHLMGFFECIYRGDIKILEYNLAMAMAELPSAI